jgi:gas vesicle protein
MIKDKKEEDQIKESIQKCKATIEEKIEDLKKIFLKVGGKADAVKPLKDTLTTVSDNLFKQLLKALNEKNTQDVNKLKKGKK